MWNDQKVIDVHLCIVHCWHQKTSPWPRCPWIQSWPPRRSRSLAAAWCRQRQSNSAPESSGADRPWSSDDDSGYSDVQINYCQQSKIIENHPLWPMFNNRKSSMVASFVASLVVFAVFLVRQQSKELAFLIAIFNQPGRAILRNQVNLRQRIFWYAGC